MVTIYVKFIPSKISDHWLTDLDDLYAELLKIMPDVKRYSVRGFKPYKHYMIEDIVRCSNNELGETEDLVEIELTVIPKNL